MPTFETLKQLTNNIVNDLKKAGLEPHPLNFIKAFVRFFLVCTTLLLGVALVLTVLSGFVFSPLINGKLGGVRNWSRYKQFETCRGPKLCDSGSYGLRKEITDLRLAVGEILDETFWKNNHASYTYSFPNYEVNITYYPAPNKYPQDLTNRKYFYDLSLCRKAAVDSGGENCFNITSKENAATSHWAKSGTRFAFDRDEIIQDITADASSIADIDGYIFSGNVTTDKGVYPFLVYPSGVDDAVYYSVDGITLERTSGIEFSSDLPNGLRFSVLPALTDTDNEVIPFYIDITLDNGALDYSIESE